ncbi:MAG TPA: hypothetical protein VGO22_18620 [Pseudorhizobium sp.]|nr:hypothetical protein [Pseudorhizobium sp.]
MENTPRLRYLDDSDELDSDNEEAGEELEPAETEADLEYRPEESFQHREKVVTTYDEWERLEWDIDHPQLDHSAPTPEGDPPHGS